MLSLPFPHRLQERQILTGEIIDQMALEKKLKCVDWSK